MMPTYDEIDDLGYRKIVDARDQEIRALKAELAGRVTDRDREVMQHSGIKGAGYEHQSGVEKDAEIKQLKAWETELEHLRKAFADHRAEVARLKAEIRRLTGAVRHID